MFGAWVLELSCLLFVVTAVIGFRRLVAPAVECPAQRQKWSGCRSSSCVGMSFFILPSSFFIRTSGPQATTATAASLLIYNRRLWLHALNAIGMPSQQSPHLSGFLRVKRFSRQAVPSCLLACGICPSHVWDRFQSVSMRRPCRIARSVRMKQRQESEGERSPSPRPHCR